MKKRIKRRKAKSALKRARTKPKTTKTTKAKTRAKAKKILLPKVKLVAKKAGLAAGLRLPDAIPVEACYLGWQDSLRNLASLVEPEINQ